MTMPCPSAKFKLSLRFAFLVFAVQTVAVTAANHEDLRPGPGPRATAQLTEPQVLSLKHRTAGKTALLQHDIPTALNEFRAYRELQPSDPEGHFYLGYCLSESGIKQEALHEYEIAEEQESGYDMDSTELRINHGNLLSQMGRIKDAENEYRRAIEVDPLAAEAHLDLAQLMLLDERIDTALRELNECSSTRGNDPRYCLLQGIANLKKGQVQSAVGWLRKCQVTSNQSTLSSRSDGQISSEAEKLLQLLKAPGS
jgi:tetratricopeptide (TPR) repeat protein